MRDDLEARAAMAAYGRSLFERGYSCGTAGNLSMKLEAGGYLVTPTNVSLGSLDPDRISRLDEHGRHVEGDPPTKEVWLHMAMYRSRPEDQAVVHLHSTYAVALSCRTDVDPDDALPPLTPYVVMRAGAVAIVPYSRPGDAGAADAVARTAESHRAILMANHGPVVSGPSLQAAGSAAEELEETARLFFLLEGTPHRRLTDAQVDDLQRVFGR